MLVGDVVISVRNFLGNDHFILAVCLCSEKLCIGLFPNKPAQGVRRLNHSIYINMTNMNTFGGKLIIKRLAQ